MLKNIKNILFEEYLENILNLEDKIEKFEKNSKTLSFDFLKINSSVFSSNIEGNSLDLNSFMNLDLNKKINKDKKEIDDLILAYNFASKNNLDENNFLNVHKIASKNLVSFWNRWKYRWDKVWVFWKEWLIYLAVEPELVEDNMKELFFEISTLLKEKLNVQEIFFYSSLIHLRFVHIHPFSDWNWRVARILEKWFLSEKLWENFWKLQSEEYYFKNRENYYNNINLWVNFYEVNYSNSFKFLKMLVDSLEV